MHILFFIYIKKMIFWTIFFLLCLSVNWFLRNFLDVIFVFQLIKPPLDNACAMLRVLVALDSKPTRLSEQSIITLSNFLSGYLIDVVHVSILSCLIYVLWLCWQWFVLGYTFIERMQKSLIFLISSLLWLEGSCMQVSVFYVNKVPMACA